MSNRQTNSARVPCTNSSEQLIQDYAGGRRAFHAAVFRGANLEAGILAGADFTDSDFTGANLEGADLRNTNFQNAILLRAVFRNANLENADLTRATGLLPAQLAGANLCSARLPDKFGDFESLRVVEEEAKNARALFLATLLACVYGWLTIATTTDVLLLTNSSSSPLPIIGATIPIVSFYMVGPLMLLLLYLYLHLHLQRLWERLADLPAVFPDGRSLGKRAYPWLLTGLVYAFNPYLKDRRPPLSRLQTVVSILMTWWLMPATILLFWTRYLRRHDWVGTSVHIVVLVSSISAGFLLYQLAAATLRDKRKNPLPFASAWTDVAAYIRAAWIGGLAVIFYFLSYGAIDGIHPDFEPSDGQKSFVDADAGSSDVRRWVPRLSRAIGYDLFADLREVDVSTRLQNWKGQQEDEINMVKRGRLRGANLRFADATRAFLVGADLARANLQGTYLYRANLRQADLTWADLRESFIYETDLQNASLKDADLRGADLSWSDLTGVNLTGARLDGANFEKANLSKTILNGTSLAEVKGLTKQQIAGALTDGRTVWPEYLYAAKSENKPDRR